MKKKDEMSYQGLKEADDFVKVARELIKLAKEKTGEIYPVAGSKKLEQGITTLKDKIMLWYNDKDNSTRMAIKEIK